MEKYYTPKEIAEILKLNINTITRLKNEGKLKVTYLNSRNYRISQTQLDDFLNKGGQKNANGK